MAKSTTPSAESNPYLSRKRLAILGVVALVAVISYFFSQRNTHHVTVGPGETVYCPIEIPMQRFWEHKSYAKKSNLAVACVQVPEAQADDGVVVTVMDTGHKLHMMWADLQIVAAPDAAKGVRKRRFDFTIDGHGGWPQATVIIQVIGNQNNR